ncbi:MAG: DUF3263 domain-containing protein [Candidatus Nanopelagicales bacterium]
MLTDTDRAILALERAWWRNPGSKEQRIRAEFGWSATRYYQRLNELLDEPAALEAEPMVVRRLKRIRDQRRRARSVTSLTGS